MAQRTTAQWEAILAGAGVPHGAVRELPEALDDEQISARQDIVEVEHPTLGTVRTIASAVRLTDGRRTARRAPFRGEDTAAVLSEMCGYDAKELVSLAERGAFGAGRVPATTFHDGLPRA